MIKITNKETCCGCTACASICPHDAIIMTPDAMGFLYPTVDLNKCTDCHLCEKVCAFNDHYDTSLNLPEPLFYGARHKDIHEVERSRSGATFVALSDWILNQGGVVYGAGYTDHFRVVHKRATTKEERDEFRGSKYVQSDMRGIFSHVKEDLKNGLTVMFSGTPCQTAGLNSFIGKKLRDKLYLVDIVCHGVPSPYIWRDYLSYLEKKHKANITEVNFRNKQKYGWAAHCETYKFDKKEISSNIFTYLFYRHIMFRPSCGACHYTNTTRPSDITLADFWGWEKTDKNINSDDKGLSLIIINTAKGKDCFANIIGEMTIIPVQRENCLQPNLCHPTEINPKHLLFSLEYAKFGFKFIYAKYIIINRYISTQFKHPVNHFISYLRHIKQSWKQ